MKEYEVGVEVLNVVKVQADSEEQAVETVRNGLVQSKQIKPNDPVKIFVIEQGKTSDEKIVEVKE